MSSSLSFGIHVRGRVVWVRFVKEGLDRIKTGCYHSICRVVCGFLVIKIVYESCSVEYMFGWKCARDRVLRYRVLFPLARVQTPFSYSTICVHARKIM